MTNACIIVLGFNRLENLQNLVSQISKQTDFKINLFLDYYNDDFVSKCRSDPIIKRCEIRPTKRNIGLKHNVIRAFKFARNYELIFVFEDDLQISPDLFQSCETFSKSPIELNSFAQLSFHLPKVNEFTGDAIEFYYNGRVTVPIQIPTSWGFLTTGTVINDFLQFLDSEPEVNYDSLPMQCRKWGEQSWKLLFYDFIVKNNLYTYYPYVTLSVPATLATGTHRNSSDFHVSGTTAPVPINLENKSFDTEEWYYDQFFEPRGTILTKIFGRIDDVRLSQVQRYGKIGTNARVLTATKASYIVDAKFPLAAKPIETNAFFEHTVAPINGMALGVVQNYPKTGPNTPILANIDFGNPQIFQKILGFLIVKATTYIIRSFRKYIIVSTQKIILFCIGRSKK